MDYLFGLIFTIPYDLILLHLLIFRIFRIFPFYFVIILVINNFTRSSYQFPSLSTATFDAAKTMKYLSEESADLAKVVGPFVAFSVSVAETAVDVRTFSITNKI